MIAHLSIRQWHPGKLWLVWLGAVLSLVVAPSLSYPLRGLLIFLTFGIAFVITWKWFSSRETLPPRAEDQGTLPSTAQPATTQAPITPPRLVSVDAVALGLILMTWRHDDREMVAGIRPYTVLSDDAVSRELMMLRMFATSLGSYVELGGDKALHTRLLGPYYMLHELLRGEVANADPLAASVNAKLKSLLDTLLTEVERQDPDAFERIRHRARTAPSVHSFNSRDDGYRALLEPEPNDLLQVIGGRFAENCQAQYNPSVQLIGAVGFGEFFQDARNYVAHFKPSLKAPKLMRDPLGGGHN